MTTTVRTTEKAFEDAIVDSLITNGEDRDNRELLFQFKRRALVHFAVDPDEAWMTTRIDGSNTRFLPFNKG